MNRGEAIAQVAKMKARAERTDFDGEREAAAAAIQRLTDKHGLTDAEIARAIAIEEAGGIDTIGFGGTKLWWYSSVIKPHVDAIKAEIEKALAKIATQELDERAKDLCELYEDLRGLIALDARMAVYRSKTLQYRRNEAITELYRREKDALLADDDYWATDPVRWHEFTVARVQRTLYDLTKSQIEAAVGVSTKKIEQRQAHKAARA